MAISYRQESLGDYAKTAADFATQAAPSAFSPEVGFTSNAYVNPITGKAYTPQDIIAQGGGDPNKTINVPYGQNFMSQWGWTLPILGAAGAALAAPASGAATAGEAGAGAGAGAGATDLAATDLAGVGAGGMAAGGLTGGSGAAGVGAGGAAAGLGAGGGIGPSVEQLSSISASGAVPAGTVGPTAGELSSIGTGGGAAALGIPNAATGAATPTGAPAGSTGAVGAQQAPAPVSAVSVPPAGGPGGVSTGAAHTPLSTGFQTGIGPLDSVLNSLNGKYAGLLLQAAGLGISAAAGKKGMPEGQQFTGMGETASQAAIQNIQMAQAGQLSGPQQATLDQYVQDAKNQVRQYFSSIGQFDSTERIKAEAQVDQQAIAMKTQLIQTTLQNGISLMGAANTPLAQVANYQLGQDKNLMDAIGRFTSGAGTILGSQAGTPAQQKTSP